MALPWLRILDVVIGVTDLARSRRLRAPDQENAERHIERAARGGAPLSGLETRLAGVVVAALKEAFDRDTRRLELERAQLEAERERAERALALELLRQAGEREITRLRLLAGVAVVCWIGTLFFSWRLIGGPMPARATLAGGWVLLLAAIAMAFVAQAQVADGLDRGAAADPHAAASSGLAGGLALWLIVLALALVGVAVLVA